MCTQLKCVPKVTQLKWHTTKIRVQCAVHNSTRSVCTSIPTSEFRSLLLIKTLINSKLLFKATRDRQACSRTARRVRRLHIARRGSSGAAAAPSFGAMNSRALVVARSLKEPDWERSSENPHLESSNITQIRAITFNILKLRTYVRMFNRGRHFTFSSK